tara:strand:- start:1082 stop:2152 length:1071 start_codon:yes stop_codon:yes gene_type:complete
MSKIQIKDRFIGNDFKPFIIAEMSGNHNQSLDRALKIVKVAAATGVSALKIQTYTADTMTLDIKGGEFTINDNSSLWDGNNLYDVYKKAYTPWDWHKPIKDLAEKLGLICFSTPFDLSALDFLETLEMPLYKIASFENTDLPLIERVALTGKPIIISTGMASIAELDETVKVVRNTGNEKLILLKCTSAYPAPYEDSNILTIPHMKKLFNCQVGISDHTMGIGTSLAAIAHGATVVEKHFTLDRSDGGIDSEFSLEPNEFTMLVNEAKNVKDSLGRVHYGISESDKRSSRLKRSIYASENIKIGETFSDLNLKIIRPGLGLPPKEIHLLYGKKSEHNIKKGTPITFDLLFKKDQEN